MKITPVDGILSSHKIANRYQNATISFIYIPNRLDDMDHIEATRHREVTKLMKDYRESQANIKKHNKANKDKRANLEKKLKKQKAHNEVKEEDEGKDDSAEREFILKALGSSLKDIGIDKDRAWQIFKQQEGNRQTRLEATIIAYREEMYQATRA